MNNIDRKIQNNFKFILIIGLVSIFLYMIRNYLIAIFFATVIVFLLYKPYKKLLKKVKNQNLSAIIFLLLVIVIILIPLSLITGVLISETETVVKYGASVANDFNLNWCSEYQICQIIDDNLDKTQFTFDKIVNNLGQYILKYVGDLFNSISQIFLLFTIFIMAFFFLLRDGEKFANYVKKMIPMKNEIKEHLFSKFVNVSEAVFANSILIGIIQGILVGVAFWICSIPGAFFWGVIASFFALIPVVGTAIVWVPGVLYLFFLGQYGYAVFLFLWGMLLIASIDNFIRMFMLDKKIEIHPFFILISVLGGIGLFGFAGIFLGPIIISLLVSTLEIYHLEFK